MIINVTFDSSVGSAPAGFTSVVNAVVQYYDSVFTDPITVNIDVGYGEVDNQALGSGALGESLTYLSPYTYSQVRSAMAADATSATDQTALASLPTTDPTGGAGLWVSTAEAKALGLAGASSAIDGFIGFSSMPNIFDYNNADGVTAGQYDFYGVVAHEISEVLGRFVGGSSMYTPLSLFDYSGAGVRDLSGSQPGYFSIDGGTTNLHAFNSNAGGDLGDWASSGGNDAYLAFANPGVVLPVSQTDLTAMDALGWNLSSSGSPPPPPPPPPADADGSPEKPTLTISNHAINVAKNGAASLPITVQGVDSDDTITVTIKGLNRYETITDGADSTVFSGSTITLTAAEVAAGLTLHSTYAGRRTTSNTLTVSASNTTPGEAGTAALQSIKVTLGTATSTTTHAGPQVASSGDPSRTLALLDQYYGAGFEPQRGAPQTEFRPWASHDDGFMLGNPHHIG